MDFLYEDILDGLENQQIALFIGPGILTSSEGGSIEDNLLQSLDVDNPDNPMIRAFYKNDGFFLFREENHRRRIVRRIKKFYDQDFDVVDNLLHKIVKLPFPLIISMIPDTLLKRAFEKEQLNFQQDFYFMGQPHQPFVALAEDKPLVYNLLGSLEEPESMVLTHKDLFNYLESIFQGKSMSEELRKVIQDTDAFVFLGLPYEKWYMQLLLRVLYHISSRLEKIEQYACADEEISSGELYKDEFRIQFVPEKSGQFIDELSTLCEKNGQLRKASDIGEKNNFSSILDKARDFLGKNKIEKGIELIIEVLEAHLPRAQNLLNEMIKLKQSYFDLHKKEMVEMATDSDKAKLNKTIFNCIALIPQITKELEL